ncbi:MAG: dimethylglycine dehydrogenase [Marinomonas primoryensis]|jgi:dimethylglycine dehydrogenase
MPMAQLAPNAGAKIHWNTRVTAIKQLPSKEWEVTTTNGTIFAQHVVNSAGSFACEVGAMVGVNVPMVNLEHQYLTADSHPDIAA